MSVEVVRKSEELGIIWGYASVADIDATLNEAEKLGAFIVTRKAKISDEFGYYGMFADPDGNVIGVWSKT